MSDRVNLVVTPSWVYVYGPSKAHLVLDEALKARNPQAFWQNKRRREIHHSIPEVDEYWRLYDNLRERFPKGVLARSIHALRKSGLSVKLSADDVEHTPADDIYMGHDLDHYDWQVEAPEKFFDHEFGVCGIPTRGGKSIVGLRVATSFVTHCSVLYLVNKQEAQKSIIEHWQKHFDTMPVFDEVTDRKGLHVLTYQAANNRDVSHFGFVIGDEIHGVGADTFFDVMMRCESAWYRLGLTGTYEGRSDGKDLWIEAAAGPVFYEVSRQRIIDAGLCAEAEVWQVPVTESIPEARGWRELESKGIINEYRNERLIECALAAWEELENQGQVLVMVQKHEHGEMFSRQLSAALGFEVPYVSSRTSQSQRETYFEKFQSGELRAAVASSIWNDSVTLPHVRVLIVGPGGKSPIRTRQILGRALTGNKKVVVVDALDQGHDTLKRHSKARVKAYKDDGYEVKIWDPS